MIYANIATLPEREQYLKQVIESIYNQVDVLEVSLNNYKAVPDWAKEFSKATFTIRANEKGDGEKFLNAEYQDGYIFTIDDDLIYPPDYCRRMVEHVERYKRKVVVSLHGRTFNPRPIASYYKSRIKGYHWNNDQITDVRVHTAGTGVMCWHSDTIKIKYADIKAANMADIWMGLFTERLGIPLMCVNHRTGWLRYILPDNIQTIYDVHYESDVLQTEIWNQG